VVVLADGWRNGLDEDRGRVLRRFAFEGRVLRTYRPEDR
jgi:hypothetical protein